jgi:hypothetical protein
VATEHLNAIGCGPREDYLGEGIVKQTIVGSVSQFDNPGIDQIAQALGPKREAVLTESASIMQMWRPWPNPLCPSGNEARSMRRISAMQ